MNHPIDSPEEAIQIVSGPGFSLKTLDSPTARYGQQLLHELLAGIQTPNAFMPQTRHEGRCRLCGELRPLTYEHIPPKAANNSTTARGVPVLTVVESADPLEFPANGWLHCQRGIGAYVLCGDCNSKMGARHVPAYVDLATQIADLLHDHQSRRTHLPATADVTLDGVQLGDVARTGLASLLALGIHDHLIRRYPELAAAVLDDQNLPPGLRLGLTLVVSSRGRYSAPVHSAGPDHSTVFSEAALEPFAWTLSFTPAPLTRLHRTADVSDWLSYRSGQEAADLTVAIPLGRLDLPYPGDYRQAGHIVNAPDPD